MANEPPKHRVRHAGHGRQHGRGSHEHWSDTHLGRHTDPFGHSVLDGIIPVLLYRESLASHSIRFPEFCSLSKRTWASAVAEARSLCRCSRGGLLLLSGFGVLAAEPLYASCRVHQALLAGEKRMAVRANFHVDVALVGRPGLKIVSASANYPNARVIGVDIFLGHLKADLSCNLPYLLYWDSAGSANDSGRDRWVFGWLHSRGHLLRRQ